jgi:hypothetical protein
MRYLKTLFWIAFILFFTKGLNAQNRISFDLRGSYSIPTEELGQVELDNGINMEANLGYRFITNASIFGGFEYGIFQDSRLPEDVIDYREMGILLGLEYNYPLLDNTISFVLRGGGMYNQVLIKNNDGDNIHDTDYGLGWFATTGIDFNISNGIHLIPTVKFKSLTRDYLSYEGIESADLRYVSIGLGVRKIF